MPEAPARVPMLQLDATSYEAAASLESLPSPQASLPPDPPVPPVSRVEAPPAPRRPSRRVRELMTQLSARHNEFMELLRGPYSGSGWGVSLFVHAVVMTALAFLVMTPERRDPPQILTIGTDVDGPLGVGEGVADVQIEAPAAVSLDASPALDQIGGSTGDFRPDLTGIFGQPNGLGRGTGGGAGDAIGAEIAGRVQAAGGQGGALQISIGWNDRNDLDLHVVTPGEERIFYARPTSSDGGTLDVDMNVNGETMKPVENVTWGSKTPRDGRYYVQVHFFLRHGPLRSPFTVRLKIGDKVHVLAGTAEAGRFTQVATFDVKDGLAVNIDTELKEKPEEEIPVAVGDTKRMEARERAAREALAEANATADPQLKAGRYRAVIRRFAGTPAAAEAQQKLDQLPP